MTTAGDDPLVAAARAASAAALAAVAARARGVADDVAGAALARQHLLGLDWHGAAASAFTARVEEQLADLHVLQQRLADLAVRADGAAHHLGGGSAW